MNGLSWMIYLAEVLPSATVFIAFMASICAIAITAFRAVRYVWAQDAYQWETEEVLERKRKIRSEVVKIPYVAIAAAIFLMALAAITPSKDTIYLIAGSEAAEMAVTSDYGKEIISDIGKVIKNQLEQLK